MSLLQALNSSASGLRANQRGLATASHNVANAGTEGYSRQRVNFGATSPAYVGQNSSLLGTGVNIQSIARATDPFYQAAALRDRLALHFNVGRDRALVAAERLFVEGQGSELGDSLNDFFNKARDLSQNASSLAHRREFLASAAGVARNFNQLARELRSLQEGIDDEITSDVERVNQLAAEVAGLNGAILAAEVDGKIANDYRDQRDRAVNQLGELVDLKVIEQGDGALTLAVAGQWTLVQGDIAGSLGVEQNADNFGLLDVVSVSPSGVTSVVTSRLRAGAIGGRLAARDADIGARFADLDTMAETFANEVNAVHQAGFGLDGVGARDLFEVPVAGVSAAANLAISADLLGQPERVAAATDAALLPGDNRNALALAELQNAVQGALGGLTFDRRFADMLQEIGRAAADNTNSLRVNQARFEQSESLAESVRGVSLDEELVDLTMFQKHFEANARVMQFVDAMMDSILQLVGR